MKQTRIGGLLLGGLLLGARGGVLLVSLWVSGVMGQEAASEDFSGASASLRQSLLKQVQIAEKLAPQMGVHILELESGETVFNRAGHQLRIVASNAKLFTTAAVLDSFGPGYFLETRLMARGGVKAGVLEGDLAVLGGGDPNISGRHHFGDPYGVFRQWARELLRHEIRHIEGDILLVDGLFSDDKVHASWPKEQLSKWYQAPIGALSFNDNCVLVRVTPAATVGRPLRVELDPPLELFQISVTGTTRASGKGAKVVIDRQPGTHNIEVGGFLPVSAKPAEYWVTVEDPVQYFAAALRAAFREEGITLSGRMMLSGSPPSGTWKRVTTYRSDLLTTLEVINKRSQNFYAESLLKLLGARHCGQGDWASGIQAVTEFVATLGIETGTFHMADGSGLSRGNRFSPVQVTTLLREMFFHRWGSEFMRTLPYSGEPGQSWKKRLAAPPYRGNVFAKTGTLRDVSAVSGYAKARSGRTYVFSILMNGTRSNWRAKQAQDAIVRQLIDAG
ncbi:MAG: D-alanyl-D-alanine carboxypeptidase/D-alanyl-D-alanine-endopeptidase [Deltaproteobacteria bacterium]|nr:D-alanyl-D-alanine carboxypeptidase/D-alanyl-D-alanine-endopeptidase [Deltaproteobacteria bacterium]